MAVTNVKKVYSILNDGTNITETSVTGDFAVDMTGADYKTAIMFRNAGSSEAKVTIPVGDGIQGVGDAVAFSVAGNATAVVVVDSGAYKHVSGDNKGKLVGKTTAELKVSAVELP